MFFDYLTAEQNCINDCRGSFDQFGVHEKVVETNLNFIVFFASLNVDVSKGSLRTNRYIKMNKNKTSINVMIILYLSDWLC